MTSAGLPVTIKHPRVTPEDKPSWETVLAPDEHQAWLLTGAQTNQVLVTPGAGTVSYTHLTLPTILLV